VTPLPNSANPISKQQNYANDRDRCTRIDSIAAESI
jgi:hypothetical protein